MGKENLNSVENYKKMQGDLQTIREEMQAYFKGQNKGDCSQVLDDMGGSAQGGTGGMGRDGEQIGSSSLFEQGRMGYVEKEGGAGRKGVPLCLVGRKV